jgi:hypothetical protein
MIRSIDVARQWAFSPKERHNVKTMKFLFLAASLLGGCATKAPDVATYYDPYTHARTDLTAENVLEVQGPGPVREVVWLNASRVFMNQTEFRYYLEVEYLARAESGFLDIPPGETLVILADGQELRFNGSGSVNSRKERKGEANERAIYVASGKQLRTIAGAQSVKVSIMGRNGIVQRDFVPANFEKFRQFVQHYVTTG